MKRDIDIDEMTGELTIVKDGRVLYSPVPRQMDPMEFRHIVAAVDMLYRRNGVIPTEDEVMETWDFKKKSVQRAFLSEELKKALDLRGVPWDPKQGLTLEQLNAILLLQNPSDTRSNQARLETIGVSMSKFRAWMRNPLFQQQMNLQAEQNLGDAVPVALNALARNAEGGDNQAILKVLEITGRWNPQQQEVQNARQVLTIFVEALEKFASPEVLRSVQDEVLSRTRMMSITQSVKES